VTPVPPLAEGLVGEGNLNGCNVDRARDILAWAETHDVYEHTAILAGEIADLISTDGPFLDGSGTMIAAISREFNAPVVPDTGKEV